MKSILIMCVLLSALSSWIGGFAPAEVGAKAREAEEALCPLQTARNLDNAVASIMRLLPFFASWEKVCEEEEL